MSTVDLSDFQDTLRCGNCRNSLKQSSKVNVTDLKQDIVVVRCDDCQKLFEQYPQFTTSFAICTCDGGAKELDLEMAKNEEPAKKVEESNKVAVIKEEEPLLTEDEEKDLKKKKFKF